MAVPKVFVSSTCYDLKEIRDNLYEFIDSLGYIPVFSDKNDVFYHPDLHTHEACLKEIESCQLFILLIGGRFGGTYVYDDKKSIVNAEYDAAKKLNLPIFTFVLKEVYSNQFTYTTNLKNGMADKIDYPAIAQQKYAKNIFEFIISVRKSDENNGLFEFEFARDIKAILRKQFAGLFYDFLWNRKRDKDSEVTKSILYDLSSISKKTEELLENIYRKVEENEPNKLINTLDLEDKARKFWYTVGERFAAQMKAITDERKVIMATLDGDDDWIIYFLKNPLYELVENNETKAIRHTGSGKQILLDWDHDYDTLYEGEIKELETLKDGFNAFKELTFEKRLKLLRDLSF
jgi:hypothetical protein